LHFIEKFPITIALWAILAKGFGTEMVSTISLPRRAYVMAVVIDRIEGILWTPRVDYQFANKWSVCVHRNPKDCRWFARRGYIVERKIA